MIEIDVWTADNPASCVLVVEDEVLVRLFLAEELREAGFEVIEAENADEALLVLRTRNDIGLVFSDVRMPGTMDGLELARIVRRDFPAMKMLLASGHLPASETGVDVPLITKPYRIQDVISRLRADLMLPQVSENDSDDIRK